WIVQRIPVISFLKNARLILIASFGLAVLAGLGLSALEEIEPTESQVRRLRAAMLGLTGLAVASLLIYVVHLIPATEIVESVRFPQIGYAYGANFELMYGRAAVGGYEIPLERLKTFLKDLSRDEMDSVMLTTNGVLETKDRRIDLLNAKYYIVSEWDPKYLEFRKQPDRFRFLYTFGATDVYENLRAFPAAFLVPASGIEVIPDETLQLARLKA